MKKVKLQLSPRGMLAIAIVAPLVLIVAGWMMLVGPQRSKASQAAVAVAAAQTQYDTQKAAIAHAPKQQPIRVADIFRLIKAMPDQQNMSDIILELNQVAVESGISFDSIVPGQLTGGAGYQAQQIQLTFSGSFYGLADFLYRLRNLVSVHKGTLQATGRLFSVQQLAFTEGKPAFPQITAQLTLDAYTYGAPAVVQTTTTPTDGSDGSTTTDTTESTTTTDSSGSPTAEPAGGWVNG